MSRAETCARCVIFVSELRVLSRRIARRRLPLLGSSTYMAAAPSAALVTTLFQMRGDWLLMTFPCRKGVITPSATSHIHLSAPPARRSTPRFFVGEPDTCAPFQREWERA